MAAPAELPTQTLPVLLVIRSPAPLPTSVVWLPTSAGPALCPTRVFSWPAPTDDPAW